MQEVSGTYTGGPVTAFPLINAVLDRVQQGRVFRDTDAGGWFILHKAGFSLLAGPVDADGVLDFFLQSEAIPGYFHVYDAPHWLIRTCNERSDDINIRIRKRIQLKLSPDRSLKQVNAAAGFLVRPVDAGDLDKLSVFQLSLERKFWSSPADFLEKGLGFCVWNEAGMPVSLCYAACMARDTAEIDVATLPDFQRQGLARLAVGAFVEACANRGIIANWDCFEENTGSLRTAESLGFRQTMSYNFLSIFNKKKKS
jgi:GNAT superfamily N-acetyltransferase